MHGQQNIKKKADYVYCALRTEYFNITEVNVKCWKFYKVKKAAATHHYDADAFISCYICDTFYCEGSSLVGYEPVHTDTMVYAAGSLHIR